MINKQRILVFHRNCLFRDCLASFLARDNEYDAESIDHMSSENVSELLRDNADVLLLDLNLPDNMVVDIARATKDAGLRSKVIILVPDDHDRLVECIAAGAHGCVLERSSLADLSDAISRVLNGETFCSPEIVATMFAEFARIAAIPVSLTQSAGQAADYKGPRLTVREQEVLELVAKHKSNKQIASELCVSLFTVKNHVHNILEKLNVDSRQEAVEMARQRISPPRTLWSPPAGGK